MYSLLISVDDTRLLFSQGWVLPISTGNVWPCTMASLTDPGAQIPAPCWGN